MDKIKNFIFQGKIHLGMTKADVRSLLGPPDGWGVTSRKYREPRIWVYGNIEFWFLIKKYRTPYPGPRLVGIYQESPTPTKTPGTMLLKS